jgi:hypothetical protein
MAREKYGQSFMDLLLTDPEAAKGLETLYRDNLLSANFSVDELNQMENEAFNRAIAENPELWNTARANAQTAVINKARTTTVTTGEGEDAVTKTQAETILESDQVTYNDRWVVLTEE